MTPDRSPEGGCPRGTRRRERHKGARSLVLAIVSLVLAPAAITPSGAWIWHEHRAVTAEAIAKLSDEQAQQLAALWELARSGHEARFCSEPSAGDQGLQPACIDLAAWPAIGGDHSCSAAELLATVGDSDWILEAAAIAARTAKQLPAAETEPKRAAVLTDEILGLADVDPTFAERAAGGTAHFTLVRETTDGFDYVASCLRPGAPWNTVGVYARAHLAALRLAAELNAEGLPPERKAELARAMLALEAFGLHFLEDSFAAGHVAGSWGDAAERLGSHDYYNVHGLETMTWAGKSVILLGDGRMRTEDLERGAAAARISLAQVLEAAAPTAEALREAVEEIPLAEAEATTSIDLCAVVAPPDATTPTLAFVPLFEVLMHTPMPARGPGIASLPRSRAELGPFVALVSGGRFAAVQGGYQPDMGGTNIDAELHLAFRGGVGLESILGEKGDGLIFAEIGMSVHREAPSGAFFEDDQYYSTSRSAFTFRWRAPFYVVPGDLLLAGPVLALVSPKTLKSMALKSADGGLIPWQRPVPTRAGRFQFILGREVGVTFFGYLGTGADRFVISAPTTPGEPVTVQELNIRSIEWEFPVLEYRALRSFASRQAYAVVFQFGAGFDKPMEVEVIGDPDAPAPELDTRYFAFARMSFDVRRYL